MLVEGLAQGIRSVASMPLEALRNLGQGAIATLKGLLGIRSPSAVFASIGVMTALGLMQGLEGMAPRVARTVEGLMPQKVQTLPVRVVPLPYAGSLPVMDLQARMAPLLEPPAVPAPPVPTAASSPAGGPVRSAPAGVTQVVRIERLELPGVRDADEFLEALKRLLIPYMEV